MKRLILDILIAIILIGPVALIAIPFEIISMICDLVLDLFDRYIVWMDKLMGKLPLLGRLSYD